MNDEYRIFVLLICSAMTTVVVECLFWACFRDYRSFVFLCCCACVNFISNMTLNLSLALSGGLAHGLISTKVLVGEAAVVIFEYIVLYYCVRKKAGKLFVLTFLANLLTYSLSFVNLLV